MYREYTYKHSSFLHKLFYMEYGGYLSIELKGGKKYEYRHVPIGIVDDLMNENTAHNIFRDNKILESCRVHPQVEKTEEEKAYTLSQIRDIIAILK